MKKILILGGTSISRQIVYAAHEMGIEVFVTDYYEDSPAKKIADKSFMISATDVDAVVDLIKKESIDGVITGYADVLLPYYVQICQKANIPCYANLEAIRVTTDKALFKDSCRQHNIPVVPEYTKVDVDEGKAIYPLIVKPVDNSGARGIYICHNRTEFDDYYLKALECSPSKNVLIERFITGLEATIFYYLHNGKAYLLGIGDRHMLKFDDKHLSLPIGYTFPSIGIDNFAAEDLHIKEMFKSLGMEEGMVFIQTFNEKGNYIVYEMGYRLTGSLEQHLMEQQYGFNHLQAMIDYAVGNEVDTSHAEILNPKNCVMANLTLLLTMGTIKEYEGIEEVKNIPGVAHIHLSYEVGKTIDENTIGRLAQVGARVLITASNKCELLETMDRIKNTLKAISTEGNNMFITNYSYQTLCK